MTQFQFEKAYGKEIKKIVSVLKKLNPQKTILFGSVAQGKIHRDSDIDICVIKETKDKWRIKDKIWDLFWDADFDWEIEPDVKIYSPSVYNDWLLRNDPFIEEIEKGKVLYEKR